MNQTISAFPSAKVGDGRNYKRSLVQRSLRTRRSPIHPFASASTMRLMARRKATSQRIAKQITELAFAAPQVVLHRTSRMAAAGASPSARDRAEFSLMGAEKVQAFYQSWAAMWAAASASQLALARASASAVAMAMRGGHPGPSAAIGAVTAAAGNVVAAGLSPVHKKAVANAKRLSKRRK